MNPYGQKVLLRAMELDDLDLLREMANDPETEKMLGGWSFPISIHAQQKWYEAVYGDTKNLRFIIIVKETGQSIGMVNLVDIDWKNRVAFHGIKLHPTAPKGKGYGTDAVMTIMKYAFEELQLRRLDGSWVEYNLTSQELYKKCGWKIEGTQREAIFKGGRYWDLHIGGVLKEEYFQAKERLGWTGVI